MSPRGLPDLAELLFCPTSAVIDMVRQIPGHFIVLGAAGKMVSFARSHVQTRYR